MPLNILLLLQLISSRSACPCNPPRPFLFIWHCCRRIAALLPSRLAGAIVHFVHASGHHQVNRGIGISHWEPTEKTKRHERSKDQVKTGAERKPNVDSDIPSGLVEVKRWAIDVQSSSCPVWHNGGALVSHARHPLGTHQKVVGKASAASKQPPLPLQSSCLVATFLHPAKLPAVTFALGELLNQLHGYRAYPLPAPLNSLLRTSRFGSARPFPPYVPSLPIPHTLRHLNHIHFVLIASCKLLRRPFLIKESSQITELDHCRYLRESDLCIYLSTSICSFTPPIDLCSLQHCAPSALD